MGVLKTVCRSWVQMCCRNAFAAFGRCILVSELRRCLTMRPLFLNGESTVAYHLGLAALGATTIFKYKKEAFAALGLVSVDCLLLLSALLPGQEYRSAGKEESVHFLMRVFQLVRRSIRFIGILPVIFPPQHHPPPVRQGHINSQSINCCISVGNYQLYIRALFWYSTAAISLTMVLGRSSCQCQNGLEKSCQSQSRR